MIYKYFLLSTEALNFLPRMHPIPLLKDLLRTDARVYVWPGGGTTAVAVTMRITSTTVDFVFCCLAAEFVFRDKDSHLKWMRCGRRWRGTSPRRILPPRAKQKARQRQPNREVLTHPVRWIRVHSSDYQLRFIYKIALFDIKLEQVQISKCP